MPVLFEENKEVIAVYEIVQTQLIMSFSGAVALDAKAIEIVMNHLDIKNKKQVFFRVLDLGNYMISKMREKNHG